MVRAHRPVRGCELQRLLPFLTYNTPYPHFLQRPIALKGHERAITFLKYSREGDVIFTCSKDNRPCVWYADNGERIGTYKGTSPGNFRLVSYSHLRPHWFRLGAGRQLGHHAHDYRLR